MRSGGYTKNNELEDALFAFGRNYNEVKEHPRCRLPKGIVNLLFMNSKYYSYILTYIL